MLGGVSNRACDGSSGIGAGNDITVGDGSGEGDCSFLGGGLENSITGELAFVGSGEFNRASATYAFVGAGYNNRASGVASFVGGGNGAYSTASGGGTGNGNYASGEDSFIGAGDLNSVSSSGNGSFIGGGGYSNASQKVYHGNQISADDLFIGAGDQHSITAASAAIVAGFDSNTAGSDSFIGAGQFNSIGSGGILAAIVSGVSTSATGSRGTERFRWCRKREYRPRCDQSASSRERAIEIPFGNAGSEGRCPDGSVNAPLNRRGPEARGNRDVPRASASGVIRGAIKTR